MLFHTVYVPLLLLNHCCVWLSDSMNCSTSGFPVIHYLPEFVQTHIHWVSDATQPSHLLLPSSPPAFNLSASGAFPVSQLFTSDGQSIGASASVLPMNIQGSFLLGLTGLMSLLSKGLKSLLQHHSSKASILQCSAFFMIQLSHPFMTIAKTIALTIQTFVSKGIYLLFNMLSRFA